MKKLYFGIFMVFGLIILSNHVYAPVCYDYGDAPDSYNTTMATNGPYHSAFFVGYYLGSSVECDNDGQNSTNADGDDTGDGTDDEDGVTFGTLEIGSNADIDVVSSDNDTYLDAWIDFNADGDFLDLGEHIFDNETLSAGTNNLQFAIPEGAVAGDTFARFRSDNVAAGLPYGGHAGVAGEVEDYKITLTEAPTPDVPEFGLIGYLLATLGSYFGIKFKKKA